MELAESLQKNFHSFGQLNTSEIENYGLWNGKTGTALLFHVIGRYTNDPYWPIKAQELFDEVAEHIGNIENYGFSDGIAGIGWAVEWLAQNDYIEANTNDILEEFDDELYKKVLYAPINDISLDKGTLGVAMYFLKRLESRNINTNRFRKICQQECLVILTDDIKTKLLSGSYLIDEQSMLNDIDTKFEVLRNILFFLARLSPTEINSSVSEDCIFFIIRNIEEILKKFCHNKTIRNEPLLISRMYRLSHLYIMAGRKLNYSAWEDKGKTYLSELGSSISPVACCQIDNGNISFKDTIANNRLNGIEIQNKLLINCHEEIHRRMLNGAMLPIGIYNGMAGITLTTIGFLKPELDNWSEVLLLN